MYRDACNFKNCESYTFSNTHNLTEDEIQEAVDKLVDGDPIVPEYYGISDHPAPLGNEFVDSGTDDHSFVEILGAKYDEREPHSTDDDIWEVVEAVRSPEIVKARRKAAKNRAIKQLEENIIAIKKIKL